jgi:glycosyltransferase involved in cell wall biosynthesis
MRKVLFVLADLEPGGAERAIVNLVRHLPRNRFEVHLALVRACGALLEEIPEDVTVHDLAAGRVRRAPLRIARLVWRLRPQVLASTLGYVNLALISLRPLLPRDVLLVVREANTVSAEIAAFQWPRLWAAAYRTLYPHADVIMCNARSMMDDLSQHYAVPRSKLRYLPNPLDVERVRRAAQQGSSPYTGVGPHLLAVGRLVPQKGFDRLIEAFARVAVGDEGAQLWILGEGPERPALEARAEEQGVAPRIHWVGQVRDPYPWMGHADVFVLSSRFEGLPNALLEALACGTRSVAFDVPGGVREVLEDLEGTALVPDGDVEVLAAAIQRLAGPRPPSRPKLPATFHLEPVIRAHAEVLSES